MARLVIKTGSSGERVLELKLGKNRLGRSPANDFPIEHPTVSARHCEITLAAQGLTARDCGSANGTFVDGRRIRRAALEAGQTLRLGQVELAVESTAVTIAIPKFEVPRPAPPVVLQDGGVLCPRHADARATHQCTHCRELLCDDCVHRLRRRGGRVLKLCPLCSHRCEPLGRAKPRKRSFLGLLHRSVKLPFVRSKPGEEEE